MYSYGWREYMPDIGRWNGIDQLAEAYLSTSTYAYVANNPVLRFDFDGRWFNDDGTIDTSGYTPRFTSGKQYLDSFLGLNKNNGSGGGNGGNLIVGDVTPDNGITLGDLMDAWLANNSKDYFKGIDFTQFMDVNLSPKDIIILFDTESVGGLGHAAVIIGNEKDGWFYYSLNGTGGDKGRAYGDAIGADIGTKLGTITAEQAIKKANGINAIYTHNYDKSIRIISSSSEDKAMKTEAAKAAGVEKYILTAQDCLTVPMASFNKLINMRGGLGPQTAKVPNGWANFLPLDIWVFNLYLPSNRELKYKK